jgi:flagellar basal-body rod modification protein FlgD
MEVTSALASATGSSALGSKAEKDLKGLADDFNNFLTLLTTQLKFQDPLEPMNSNEFVSQLVQFTQVEQSISTNKNLEQLLSSQNANATTGALAYMGKAVEAESDVLSLQNGSAEISYTLPTQSSGTTIIVLNSAGNAIASAQGQTNAGKSSFVWDGKDQNGAQLPDGAYRFVVAALDSEQQSIGVTTAAVARVTGVETTKEGILLSLGATQVPVSKVMSIREASTPTTGI